MNVELAILIPAITGILCWICPRERFVSWIGIAGSFAGLLCVLDLCAPVFLDGTVTEYSLWYVDGLSALFMTVTSVVTFSAVLYSKGYLSFERSEKKLNMKSEKHYYLLIGLFATVMLSVFAVSSVGLLWIIIEATTLISTFLVGFYRDEKSTEAAWKYLIICSVGITLALIGISLLYASTIGVIENGSSALDWPVLMAAAETLDPVLMKTAMVLVIIGFGTKAGFAPMHTWLPDAHSQAPTPVSALLSAALLNCAMFGILRFYAVSEITVPDFAQTLMLIFGLLSIFIAAMFILASKDMKRMLAYSSIEHMGLIAVGFGIGTSASIAAALFMVMAHSFTKPILFFCAGNIMQAYGTKDMGSVRGMRSKMPFTSFMLVLGTLAIVGLPPFAVFAGEFQLLFATISSELWWTSIIMITLLLIIFAGFVLHIFPMLGGETEKDVRDPRGISRHIPFIFLGGLVLFFGLFMPESLGNGFDSVVGTVFGGSI